MAQNDGLDDLESLLAGLDNDLLQPSPQKTEKTPTPSEPSPPEPPPEPTEPPSPIPAADDAKIQDLLAGLDDAFFTPTPAPPPPPPTASAPPPPPAEETETTSPPTPSALDSEESPISDFLDSLPTFTEPSTPSEPGPEPAAVEPPAPPSESAPSALSDLSLDLPPVEDLDIHLPPSPPSVEPEPGPTAEAGQDILTPPTPQPFEMPASVTAEERPQQLAKEKERKRLPELSEKQLRFIQMRVSHFGPALREAVTRIIVEETLDPKDISQLLQLILGKKSVEQIHDFVQRKTGRHIPGPLLDEEYVRRLKAKKRAAARRQRLQAERPSLWDIFVESVLPALKPLAAVAAVAGLFFFVVWPLYEAERLVQKGLSKIDSRTKDAYQEAEELLKTALKRRSGFFQAYLRYADAYIRNRQYDRAEEKLTEYQNHRGENLEWLVAMGNLRAAQENLEGPDGALAFFERAKEKSSKDFRAIDGLAQTYLKLGRPDRSLTYYAEFSKNHPGHINAHFRILSILISQGRTLEAEQKWREILRLRPDGRRLDPVVATDLARHYIDLTLPTSPYAQDRSGRTFRPPFLTAFTQRPVTARHVIDEYRSRAYNVLQRVVQAHPDYAPAWFQHARLAVLRGNLFSADRALERGLKALKNRNAADPDFLVLRGVIAWQRNDPTTALENFREAIDLDANHILAYYYLAKMSYERYTNSALALANYLRVHELLPEAPPEHAVEVDTAELRYRLGWLFFNAKDFENANRHWSLFLQERPDNPAASLGRGTALLELNNPELALKDLEAAVSIYRTLTRTKRTIEPNKAFDRQLYHNLSAAYNNLGIAQYRRGDLRQALASFYQSIEAIKTVGFFNEREEANINLHFVLRPTPDTAARLMPSTDIPKDHELPE